MLSRNLEGSLHRALGLASERHHEYATLEHLLLALVDDLHLLNDNSQRVLGTSAKDQQQAESAGKDQGATFTVTFPVPPLLVEPPEKAEEAPALAGRPALAGLRLLVVEDEDSSREMLAALLRQDRASVRVLWAA